MRAYLTRRGILGSLLAGSTVACSKSTNPVLFTADSTAADGLFTHGIASGDPLSDRVILWTRITPENPNAGSIPVQWQISTNTDFEPLAGSGTFETHAARNWTVKVDASGLTPGKTYYYRFQTDIYSSPIGRTRTLPVGDVDSLRFAVVSCANWQHGFFNAYDHIARSPYDALIHLGDYLYEYGVESILGTKKAEMGRLHEPRHETVSLEDYRTRHAQYRTDPSLQAVTARMPMIAIWDDHESTNDSWKGGAENHQDEEGNWDDRKARAMRAYYEWMPVRDPEAGKTREHLYRSFEWGNLLTMAAVETRLLARGEPVIIDDHFDLLRQDKGPEKFRTEILNDPSRDMLGAEQLTFITDTFKASKDAEKPWRVLANQVVMGKLSTPDLTPHVDEASIAAIEPQWDGIRPFVELSKYGLPVYPDSWDGYPAAREKLYQALKDIDVTDMLVITGDAHEFWANDLTQRDGIQIGVELGTSSVSSETLGDFLGEGAEDYALLMTQSNMDVRYYNPVYHGYIDLEFTHDKAHAKMIAIDNVASTEYGAFQVAAFTIRPTKSTLKFSSPQGLNLKQRALFNGLG